MTRERTCPDCGKALPADGPRGLCPECLMGAALSGRSANAYDATGGFEPAGTGVLATIAKTTGAVPRVLLRDTAPGEEPGPVVRVINGDDIDQTIRYRIDGEIARGGMGAVLKGRDPDLGRDVALKVLRDDFRDNADMVCRFVEEAQIGGQLQHPGIVPIYELGTFSDRRPFFAMKLVKGHTLAQLLEDRKSPADDLPRFLSIFEAVCQTMAYAHARGVIHRDLKPSNVMVGSFGEVQVMDWGLAKVLNKGGVVDDARAGKNQRQETVIATARSGSDEPGLSHAGSVMGTPAYMAPEQARGEVDLIDERADVFALGSILCEMLTDEPAFVGRSSGEIQRKAAVGDLTDALARLGRSDADSELIALATDCLAREPEDRPRSATAVAEKITAHLSGVQERLRIAERERAVAEARAVEEHRRRKLQLGLAASLMSFLTAGGLGATYFVQQRQARAAAAEQVLGRASTLRDLAREHADDPVRWQVAMTAIDQAEGALGADAQAQRRIVALKAEVKAGADAAERDRQLLDRLVDIRSAKADDHEGFKIDEDYGDSFRDAGVDMAKLPAAEAAAKIKARPPAVAMAMASALDDWAFVRRNLRNDTTGAGRLAEVAKAADSDPWRNGLRDAIGLADAGRRGDALKTLAGSAKFDELGPVSLDLLGNSLADSGAPTTAESVLRRAQIRYPGDVWINFDLGKVLATKLNRRDEAIRFYTAARALRPETAESLAEALNLKGASEESIEIARDLTRLRPSDGQYRSLLAYYLAEHGRIEEAAAMREQAIAALREQIRTKPDSPNAHNELGLALEEQGKLDEAVAESREAIRIRPDIAVFHQYLGMTLMAQGKLDEAVVEQREAIRLEPGVGAYHHDLGVALHEQGKLDQAVAEYREAARLRPHIAQIRRALADGLLDQGKLDEAAEQLREAIRIKSDDHLAHFKLGIALAKQGKIDEAIGEYQTAIRANPAYAWAHLNLGVLLQKRRDYAGAVAALRMAHELGSKQPGAGEALAQWLANAEKLAALADRLPKILTGEEKPRDAAEGLAAGYLCYEKSLHASAARLYKDAFAAEPQLAEDLTTANRYNAACCAALAGAGKGDDKPPLGESDKARWRAQAVAWLKTDLLRRAEHAHAGGPKAKTEFRQHLQHSKVDSDLAGIRDEALLNLLPQDEQKACRALWAEVDRLLKTVQ